MNESHRSLFEQQLLFRARALDYPPTPDIAGSVIKRLQASPSARPLARPLAWSLTLLLVLCASLLLIPPARAAILEFIQIGVVRIFRNEPEIPATLVPLTATPQALIPQLERMTGEMTLAEAQAAVDYPLLLPSYPSDLGAPERVFVQDLAAPVAVLVWLDPQRPEQVLMSLHFIPEDSWAIKKVSPKLIEHTAVDGRPAVWTVGPYPVRIRNGDFEFVRLVDGHVLIWADESLTYRLETDLSLEEALKIAESLEPVR